MTRDSEAARVGLCVTCVHRTIVVSRHDSRFYLCERSRTDPRYPRYPALPVVACAGWEPLAKDQESDPTPPPDGDPL